MSQDSCLGSRSVHVVRFPGLVSYGSHGRWKNGSGVGPGREDRCGNHFHGFHGDLPGNGYWDCQTDGRRTAASSPSPHRPGGPIYGFQSRPVSGHGRGNCRRNRVAGAAGIVCRRDPALSQRTVTGDFQRAARGLAISSLTPRKIQSPAGLVGCMASCKPSILRLPQGCMRTTSGESFVPWRSLKEPAGRSANCSNNSNGDCQPGPVGCSSSTVRGRN